MENGKWKVASGKWQVVSCKWQVGEPSDGTNFGGNEILNHSLGFAGEKQGSQMSLKSMENGKWKVSSGKCCDAGFDFVLFRCTISSVRERERRGMQ